MDPNLTILAIAVLNAFTAYVAWKTHKQTKKVEEATNGMKDALMKAVGDKRFAEGLAEGKTGIKAPRDPSQ